MKKLISLIKVSLNHDMNIFKINTKKQNKYLKVLVPIIIVLYLMFIVGLYAREYIKLLIPMHLEFIVLTIFALSISVITLIEGIYKSGSLLFNTKDDNLLLSLPINKNTILFVRILKFYIFELLYNSLFLAPAMIVYAYYLTPNFTYYIASFVALLILPIVPIILSTIIGFIITFISSKLKSKNIMQTIITTIILLGILYMSFNSENFVLNIVKKASSINDFITRLYYPVGAYINLVKDFNIKELFYYIFSNLIIFFITMYILSKFYFKINSSYKRVLLNKNKKYKIKNTTKIKAFIKKEINRFISTPVFITNAGFGLVLYVIFCIFILIKFDSINVILSKSIPDININFILNNIPILLFCLIIFTSFMTSITSSMISLEGKSFSILKSLPIKPLNIIIYKVITALLIMIPCILIGDIIIFIKFKFDLINILLIIISSIILPCVSELIGIIINLKYPKMDATNDTEIVKQSMSSVIALFIGIFLAALSIGVIYKLIVTNISASLIILILLTFYTILFIVLYIILIKKSEDYFNNINV